ncbi:MAG: M23 family metallopeptidase [Gemmatimonadota bacterium]|nr:M23 family metallopeptidase [Gemmatimonadota bacterium]
MSRGIVRVVMLVIAALAVWVAARQVTSFGRSSADIAADSLRALDARTRRDTLHDGETLDILLRRGGLDGAAARQVLAATPMIDPRRVRPGMAVEFISDSAGSPATEIVFKLAIDRHVRVTRSDSVAWSAREVELPWTVDTIIVRGAVANNLYDALHGAADELFPGASHNGLVFAIADVYKFRVDMSRELRKGDSVHAVIERARGPESSTRVSQVLATRLFVGNRPIEAFYFEAPSSSNVFYDGSGKSLATAFLRSPVEFARVTSSFGMRFHPILRIRRAHEGVDYGAAQGTPVMSIGDGTVVRAGDAGGYGNVVEVRHPNGYVSRYAHLSRFSAKGQRGNRVNQGDVIGYVGRTGLSTAAHLHFEILVGGNQTSPTVALRNVDGTPLPSAAKPAFDRVRSTLLAFLGRPPGVVRAD